MNVSRRRFVGLAAALTGVPRAAVAQARALTIGYVPSTLFAPVFVAQESGYLRDAGFNASLTPIVAGQDAMALVAQGQLDCVTAGLSAAFFNAVNRNLEVKFVASTGYQPKVGHPTALMMRQDLYDAGAHNAGALRGKKIGWLGGAGATAGYYVARILRKYGLRLSDVQALNIAAPDQQVALERKAVDAMFASAPFTAVFQQQHLATVCDSVPAGISGTGIFFGPTLLRDIAGAGALMQGFRRGAAAVAGVGYYSEAHLAAMAKYVNQPAALIRTTDRYDFKPDLGIDLATLLDMQREFLGQGILAYQTPLNEVRLVAKF